MQSRIRLGMVGGGEGAFIGAVHRYAARLDGHYELLAGALTMAATGPLASSSSGWWRKRDDAGHRHRGAGLDVGGLAPHAGRP